MKKLFLLTMGVLFLAGSSFAMQRQHKHHKHNFHHKHHKYMMKHEHRNG